MTEAKKNILTDVQEELKRAKYLKSCFKAFSALTVDSTKCNKHTC